MKVLLTGGTGFIGKHLLRTLQKEGHRVIILKRNVTSSKKYENTSVEVHFWDAKDKNTLLEYINRADAVINLIGEPVVKKRWSRLQKEKLEKTRIDSTNAIVQAILESNKKPEVLINASAVGYYGNTEDEEISESHTKGKGFLAEVCEKWESGAQRVTEAGVRVVLLRIGVVLGRRGGALSKILPPFKFFVGGPIGSGKQWFPWIHRKDISRIVLFALDNKNLSGPVNATSPYPKTMNDFLNRAKKGSGEIEISHIKNERLEEGLDGTVSHYSVLLTMRRGKIRS